MRTIKIELKITIILLLFSVQVFSKSYRANSEENTASADIIFKSFGEADVISMDDLQFQKLDNIALNFDDNPFNTCENNGEKKQVLTEFRKALGEIPEFSLLAENSSCTEVLKFLKYFAAIREIKPEKVAGGIEIYTLSGARKVLGPNGQPTGATVFVTHQIRTPAGSTSVGEMSKILGANPGNGFRVEMTPAAGNQ
jgi:hypothetical protein